MSADEWIDCWLCADYFGRRRPTTRRCVGCSKGFCEGEHGFILDPGTGTCLRCRLQQDGLVLTGIPTLPEVEPADKPPTDA